MSVNISEANISAVQLAEQGSTPATPASGFARVFAKSDGLYYVDDAGAVKGPFADLSDIPAASTDDQTAAEVPYDNGASGLLATDVQDAIDELAASSGASGGTDDQIAAEVPYDNGTSGLAATDVQAAIDEIAAGGVAGAMQLISEFEVSTPQPTIDFSSIPQTFRHLKIVAVGGWSTTQDWIQIQFNGDTASNYDWQTLRFSNTTPSTGEALAQSALSVGEFPNNANEGGAFEIDLFDYAGTQWQKKIRGRSAVAYGTSSGQLHPREFFGRWRSVAAINQITFLSNVAGNFRAGTKIEIYGIG